MQYSPYRIPDSRNYEMNQLCKVCGEPAAGFHFGAFTCEGCKSFFGRTYNNVSGISECKNGGRCEITKKNRTSCKSCRLRKCLSVGMSKSGSRYGRRSNWFKIHCLLSAQSQNGGMNSGSEANNNNSSTTNNNNPQGSFPPNSMGKSPIPSTVTSLGSLSGNSVDERERDRSERERTPSSSASRNGATNGLPPAFSSFAAGLSPESREQFLASLNRKLVNPELADYFRAAGVAGLGGLAGAGAFPMPGGKPLDRDDDRGEDMSRTTTTRSPGSLESPNSEASTDENKITNSLFTMPPGSPLEVKPDLLSFDFLTRDLIKMGYDPLRLWPAMLTAAPPNLHSFNPYRFIFPGAFPGAFPGGYPPNAAAPSVPSPSLLNGAIHPSKLLSAASGIPEGLASPLANLPNNLSAGGVGGSSTSLNSGHHSTTPTSNHGSPNHSIRNRVTPVVPPSSSLTLTPPISHHSSEEPVVGLPVQKFRNIPTQDKPMDLSAKSTNNNYVDDDYQDKKFSRLNGDLSPNESDSEDEHDNLKRGDLRHHHHHHHLHHIHNSDKEYDSEGENEPQSLIKSEFLRNTDDEERADSDVDDRMGEAEDLRSSNNNNELLKPGSRRRSSSTSRDIRSPKRERVSTPLDLTRSTSSTPVAPPKIAT
ncbi:unnamed protein product [Orchesella dallaii]|uniref:Nuclear receptor domain-containing protein n=1 Tax=Orchesella dallaii TaxID=48710 RepID=A0ABP1RNA1_9HEXA